MLHKLDASPLRLWSPILPGLAGRELRMEEIPEKTKTRLVRHMRRLQVLEGVNPWPLLPIGDGG